MSSINQIKEKLETNIFVKWINKDEGDFLLKQKQKVIKGKLSSDNESVKISITQTNYNHSYARVKVKNVLRESNTESMVTLNLIAFESGDIIRTTSYADELNSGDELVLSYDTHYYSKNNSAISCNHKFLGEDVLVTYLETENNRCLGSNNTTRYAIFKIL